MNATSDWTDLDRAMMSRALALAQRGLHTTDPNPRVGCVLVHGTDIVGEGWHSDTPAVAAPPMASLLYGEDVPPYGSTPVTPENSRA